MSRIDILENIYAKKQAEGKDTSSILEEILEERENICFPEKIDYGKKVDTFAPDYYTNY